MNFAANALQAAVYLIAISAVLVPLEHFWRGDRFAAMPGFSWLRRDWLNDLCFYLGQTLVFNSVTLIVLGYLFQQIETSSFLPVPLVQLPLPIKIVLVILLSDLLIYWGHRAQHRIGFLWRFHRVHHTALQVDYLAAYREHPLDNIYTRGLETLPAVLLGLDLNLIAGFVTFRGLWALFIHSNTNIRLGFLEVLLGSPHLHHWHHELHRRGLVNYANLSPLMDVVFGTYYNPPERPGEYGVADSVRQPWVWQMLDPFIKK